jgi:hypothetical protein
MLGLPIWVFSRMLPGLVVSVLLVLGIKSHDTKVATKAVNAALVKERAVTTPLLNTLTTKFNEITHNIVESRKAAKLAADGELAAAKLEALNKSIKYQHEISAYKKEAAQFAVVRATDARLADERLRDATRPLSPGDGSDQQGIRLSGYTDRLSSLYAQCDKDLGDLIETAATTLGRLVEAEAAVRALSPVK